MEVLKRPHAADPIRAHCGKVQSSPLHGATWDRNQSLYMLKMERPHVDDVWLKTVCTGH